MHNNLTFRENSSQEISQRVSKLAASIDGLKRSIEYLQDYISIAGLKMYQEEFARVINYSTEQEANRYLKKKTFDNASRFQSKAIPIPRLSGVAIQGDDSGAINFMGRVANALLTLTDSTKTVYAPECSAWFIHSAPSEKVAPTQEVCGIRTFALLEKSLGTIGLRGLDRLLSFRAVYEFNSFLKFYNTEIYPFRTLLDQVRSPVLAYCYCCLFIVIIVTMMLSFSQ
jgi:WASH complex subunit strumpellin